MLAYQIPYTEFSKTHISTQEKFSKSKEDTKEYVILTVCNEI